MSDNESEDGVYSGDVDSQGRMHGKGKFIYPTGDCYEGDYFEDEMHGKGRYTWEDGSYYEGDYYNGAYHGFGTLCLPGEETYTGEWYMDERQGKGTSESSLGVYTGDWRAGKRHGKGILKEKSGATYEGDFADDFRQGIGKCVHVSADGHRVTYEGEWKNDVYNGRGLYEIDDEQSYDGEFKDGQFDGHGTYTWKKGGVTFIGEFKQGKRHGPGCERSADGTRTGTWVNGLPGPDVTLRTAVDDLTEKMDKLMLAEVPTRRVDIENVPPTTPGPGGEILTAKSFQESDFEGWQGVRLLGRGSFGAAYEAVLHNGRTVCVKIIELGAITDSDGIAKLHNEIDLMKRLNHPNIVQYYGSVEDKEKKTLNIFMEYVDGGSLTAYAKKMKGCGALSDATIRDWSYQMVCGVKYLHDSNVVHRDIKGDNILVSMNTGTLKLADFGCSKSIDDICSKTHGCKTMVGTPYWMAPEVITCAADSEGYGPKSDIWSVGCTIVEMITGKPAWPECNSMWAAIYKIANSTGLPPFFQENHDKTHPQFLKFLERMFERSPPKRASAKELLEDPYLAPCRR